MAIVKVIEKVVAIVKVGIQGPQGLPGDGDMKKSVYDVDEDGVVDEAEKIDGGTW